MGEVVKGDDPAARQARQARKAATVAELCDAYLEAAEAGRILTRRRAAKKPSTLVTDKGRVERHIKPLLGRLKVVRGHAKTTSSGFMHAVTDGETKARIKTGKHGLGARHGRARNRHAHDGLARRDLLVRGQARAAGR